MTKITENMTIHEVLTAVPDAAPAFLALGMHCLGCPMSRGETVAEAAHAHGADVKKLLDDLNRIAGNKAE